MFTNLVESSADKSALKRRSSFFLATVASYALFLFAAGIVGVLTYDAQVEAQTTDMLVDYWIPPVDREPDRPRPANVSRPRANAPVDRNLTESTRTKIVTTTDDPSRVPDKVGVNASDVPPAIGPVRLGPKNIDAGSVSPGVPECVTCNAVAPTVVETEATALPPKPPKPTTLRVSPNIIASKIIALPKPGYPPLAKQARIQGAVNVQILVDEAGEVISAQAIKGSPLLVKAAEDAARRARFTPTKLGDQPVKVQGVITYNFVLQ